MNGIGASRFAVVSAEVLVAGLVHAMGSQCVVLLDVLSCWMMPERLNLLQH